MTQIWNQILAYQRLLGRKSKFLFLMKKIINNLKKFNRTREPLSSSLSRTKNNHSQSAYDLDTISKAKSGVIGSRHKSTSLQHLEDKHQNGHRYNARHVRHSNFKKITNFTFVLIK